MGTVCLRRASLRPREWRALRRADASGFSLIEMLIVVAIIAILAAIAFPSYRQHMLHANRAAAEDVMLSMASAQERYMVDNRSYSSSNTQLGGVPNTVSPNYTIAVTPAAGPPPSYTITATPIGGQAADTACNVLTYSSDGTKSPSQCWN